MREKTEGHDEQDWPCQIRCRELQGAESCDDGPGGAHAAGTKQQPSQTHKMKCEDHAGGFDPPLLMGLQFAFAAVRFPQVIYRKA